MQGLLASAQGNISTGNVSGIGIAIGHGAQANVTINQIVQGLGDLPTHYDGPVRNFFEYYLGTPEHPAPFGGREADLAVLDQWLDDANTPRYLLLAAPAGQGKSALLAHWISRLTNRDDAASVHTVFFPISARFNSNREAVVFPALYARIAHLHGDKATRAADAHEYRNVFMDYVRRPPHDGCRVLIVLDGLDEAAGWEAGTDLFPAEPPPHLRVVVAARVLAGDPDWLTRLGWDALGKAKPLSLAGLDRDGVRDVLDKMGNPLDALATKIDVVTKLHELSEGDPLLVRLYVEALQSDSTETATFTPEVLLNLKPGLKPYFDLWFKQQESLWQSADKQIDHDAVGDLLNVCANALGPLTKDDVHALAPERLKNSRTIERAVSAVNRFVIGDGTEASGYVFSHPRLHEYFANRLTAKERAEWQKHFLRYGKNALKAIEAKTLKPSEASAYAVKYYGAHLTQANAPAADFYALMCEGWLRAWEWVEGTPDGFVNDTRRAWARAEGEGPTAVGQIARAALCVSSVISLANRIPGDFLNTCLKFGVINPRLALIMVRSKVDAHERAQCLMNIRDALPTVEQPQILAEALVAVGAALAAMRPDDNFRQRFASFTLIDIIEHLTSEATDLLAMALQIARTTSDEELRGKTLGVIVDRLPPDSIGLLSEALNIARAISNEYWRASALGLVARNLPPTDTHLWAEVIDAAKSIGDDRTRATGWNAIVKCLPLESSELLSNVLADVRAMSDAKSRVMVLSGVASRLPAEERLTMLAEALVATRGVDSEESRVSSLSAIMQLLLPEETRVLAEALSVARSIRDELWRARALSVVAEHLFPDQGQTLLVEALDVARACRYQQSRAEAMREVAERFPESERRTILAEALGVVQTIEREDYRSSSLSAIVQRLSPEATDLLAESLRVVQAIEGEYYRSSSLSAIVQRLPPKATDLLAESLHVARTIGDEGQRTEALRVVAERLPPLEQRAVLTEAWAAAGAIRGAERRVAALTSLARHFPSEDAMRLLSEALQAIDAIDHEERRISALCTLTTLIPPEAEDLLCEVLRIARKADIWGERALKAVVERLPVEAPLLLDQVVAAARAISWDKTRASVLSAIAPHLPPEQRPAILHDALQTFIAIDDGFACNSALCVAAEHLPLDDKQLAAVPALQAARRIGDIHNRAVALLAVVKHLPLQKQRVVLAETLAAARMVSDGGARAHALSAVANLLPVAKAKTILYEALRAARTVTDDSSRADALINIAKRLPPIKREEVLAEALSAARAIHDQSYRASALSKLAEHFPHHEQRVVLTEALHTAQEVSIWDWRYHYFALSAVAACLPPGATDLLAQVLHAARMMSDEADRASMLLLVVEQLPLEEQRIVLAEALGAARMVADKSSRASFLTSIAKLLPPKERDEVLVEALTTVRAVRSELNCASILITAAKLLPPPDEKVVLAEALRVGQLVDSKSDRAKVLYAIAECLPPKAMDICHELLREVRLLFNESTAILHHLAPHWSTMCRANGLSEFGELSATLQAFSKAKRENLLRAVSALLPVIHRLGGERAVRETAQAIIDTAKWWP